MSGKMSSEKSGKMSSEKSTKMSTEMSTKKSSKTSSAMKISAASWLIALVAGLAVPSVFGEYGIGIGLTFLMWVAMTLSWSVLSRLSGYVSLGHAVFYGLGAYLMAAFWGQASIPVIVIGAGLAGGLFAALVGTPVLRVRGPYFVILSFGLAELVKFSVLALESALGVSSRIIFNAPELSTLYYAMLGLAVASVVLYEGVRRARLGLGLRALRENEEAAETVGIPVASYKLAAYVLSAILPAMVGALMAMRTPYFSAGQSFDPMISVTVIAMAVLGGGERVSGALAGVIFLTVLAEVLWASAPLLYMVLLGSVLIGFVLVAPDGVIGLFGRLRNRWLAQGDKS